MNAKELYESLKLTNNGYLFAPNGFELACAKANPDKFTVRGGVIYPFAESESVMYKGEEAVVLGMEFAEYGFSGFNLLNSSGIVVGVSVFLLEKLL